MNELPPLPTAALEPHVRQIVAIAELMLGAAHADGNVSWPERSAIADVLMSFLGHRELPDAVVSRMQGFDPTTFDVETACAALTVGSSQDRAELLGLIARVTDADALLQGGEEGYLRRVARAIGASDEELAPFLAPDAS
jgi:uncharacterized tellurite resistance protein B-like protein